MPIDKSSRDMNRWLARHVPRRASHPRWMFQTHEWLFRGIKTWPFRYKIRESKEWSRKGHPYRIAIILNQVHLMSKYIHQRIWTIFSQFLHSLLIDLPVGLEVSWRRLDSMCAPHMPWKRHRIRITSCLHLKTHPCSSSRKCHLKSALDYKLYIHSTTHPPQSRIFRTMFPRNCTCTWSISCENEGTFE